MAAPKGKIVDRPVFGNKRPGHGIRTRKMIRPHCEEHFPQSGEYSKYKPWWDYCTAQGHTPYLTAREVEYKTPILEERDGRTFKIGETIEVEVVYDYNWAEVPDEIGVYSGRGVAESMQRGFKFPEDFGFARFCDYKGCSKQNPKFRTPDGGMYHARDEAALMVLRADETAVFVTTERKARAAQLAAVNIETGATSAVAHDHQ